MIYKQKALVIALFSQRLLSKNIYKTLAILGNIPFSKRTVIAIAWYLVKKDLELINKKGFKSSQTHREKAI